MTASPSSHLALTIGRALPDGGWAAVTDRGERLEVPGAAARGWTPVNGQRVVAQLDASGVVTDITVPGSSLPLPRP